MAMLDEAVHNWGTTALVGLGVAVAAPLLLPAVGAVLRPVAKGLIKGGLVAMDSLQEMVREVWRERLAELVAQAMAEHRRKEARKTETASTHTREERRSKS